MKYLRLCALLALAVVAPGFVAAVRSASVDGTGYTNSFGTQPSAADWATASRAGAQTDTYDMDLDVNANITASGVTNQTTASVNNPPAGLTVATWSSTGLYLQTRPTGNRYTVLMGKFVNNTGSNATQIDVSYLLTFGGVGAPAEDSGLGTRAYYSLTGATGSWVNIPAFNTEATNGSFNLGTNLPVNWPNGADLFLLWADDNALPATDKANQIDDFSLRVTASTPPVVSGTLTAPAHNGVYSSDDSLTASATALNGTAPYLVQYWTNSGAGNATFQLAGSSSTAPFNVSLGKRPLGTYNIYATVTDQNGAGDSATTGTNTISVIVPLNITLVAPTNGAKIDHNDIVTGRVTLAGGTPPYSVQFYLNGAPNSGPVTSPPYERQIGSLLIGNYTISAAVTDASGWVSNSLVHTIHITGPLSVSLTPTDGASFVYGQQITLAGVPIGGNGPYNLSFFVNGAAVGTATAPPFQQILTNVQPGSYTSYVHAADSSVPAQQTDSGTNVFTVLANPLTATLTSPTSGGSVIGGQSFVLNASAAVTAPVTVTRVDFYVDGLLVGADGTAPYSVNYTVAQGSHTAYAVAFDSLARQAFSVTNQFTATAPANAGSVGPAGYFNDFSSPPVVTEWGGFSRSGASTDNYDMDSAVNSDANVGSANSVPGTDPGNPPDASAGARWSSSGLYLQTRPTGNRYTVLFGKFQNNSGTNATQITVSYLNTITAGANEEAGRGTRVYYSPSGAFGTWINLPALNVTAVNTGPITRGTNIAVNWPNGSNFYLLWADDNAAAVGLDAGFQIDNFSLQVTAGTSLATPPIVNLTAPTNGASFLAPPSISLTATASDADGSVTRVEFFADGAKLGEDLAAPYSLTWSNPPLGDHVLRAVATDDQGNSAQSANINIVVFNTTGTPFARITNPTNGTTVEGPTNLIISATAAAVSGVTNVEFYNGPTLIGSSADGTLGGARADYQFQNSLDSSVMVPPPLANLGPNVFTTANVDGQSRTVLRFAANDGLSLASASGLVAFDDYTVVVLFSFDTVTSWRRLLDLREGSSDNGLYNYNGTLYFYPWANGANAVIPANTYVQVVLTRHSDGAVNGYIDGVQQFSFVDSTGDSQITSGLRFFRDDGTEGSAGTVARIRLFAGALTPTQVAALDRLPGAGGYAINWNAPFGSHALTSVAVDANGVRGTSAVVNVTINIPPTNTVPPTIAGQSPFAGAGVGSLNSVMVTFSERVINVDAADLLVNGVPASQVTGSHSNYTFSFAQPAFGLVTISWATNHGITDVGYPSNLAFNATGPGATWTYSLNDNGPPTIIARVPGVSATVTNLTQATVTFSEPVTGVDAADLLVNGVPAFGLSGSGAIYTFSFSQPAAGPVTLSWSDTHGITDLAASPNQFYGPSGIWSVTLDSRTVLVQSNVLWRFVKGTAEASTPIDAWRFPAFDDSGWSNALAPFYFGDPYNTATDPGTLLSDMQGGYTSIYLRQRFNVFGAGAVTNLFFNAQSDDGFILWINSTEVMRYNMPGGTVPYNGTATVAVNEPNQRGAAFILYNLNTANLLSEGENVLAIHAFNQSLSQSTDFGFNAQLFGYLPDASVAAPRIAGVIPPSGELFVLTNITVQFTEPVTGVNAGDLLINGVPATAMSSTTNTTYTFGFAEPAFGPVGVTWAAGHGIMDFDTTPKSFDGNGASATFQYTLVNPGAPTVASQTPLAGATIGALTQINVLFSEAVANVNASDLLVNGVAATGLSGSGASYTFTVAPLPYGPVSIGWAANHGITDVEPEMNPFDGTRQGNVWSYTLVDQTPPTIAALSPPAGSLVTNLTQVTVTFSEPVTGVNAGDLRVNGVACLNVSGTNASYTFTFAQPNATLINFTWINTHGISDLAATPNAFNASAPGSTWSYSSPDTLAPGMAIIEPAPFITVPSLTQVRVTFTEPVIGVGTNGFLINNAPALSVSGSGAGPYTFSFLPPANGLVTVRWATGHGITDLAGPMANPFGGGQWTYTLEPGATFAGKVVINEIMFNARGGLPSQEWIELRNVTTNAIGLAGWSFSRGVNFTFPNVSLAPGGYLVVAADLATFQADYPNVTNAVGGWTGSLANSDETVELETAQGERVNSVHYATEGDWARRERGKGAELVESITRNGSTATVRIFNHGFQNNDSVLISGADQPEYNGRFNVTGAGASTFNITVSGTPASPATGDIICRQIVNLGASGWSWFSAAAGFGSSVELVNASLPNASGQNWLASTNSGGTPGRANSVASANIAPLILDVTHFPPVPRSTETVSITARVRDELAAGVSNVTLFYRNHTSAGPGAFGSTNMLDDGAHSDGLNGDGLFGAVLPAAANGTVIEFYVQANDTGGLTRTWPAPTWETNGTFAQLANALYQVDDEVITNLMPSIRIVLSGTERASFPPANRNSDAAANHTFISADGDGTKIRYLAGVRVRGAGSRTRTPPNNRVNLPNDNRWNGLSAVNLNGQFIHAQLMGAALAQKAGVPASPAHIFQYRINGVNPAPIAAPVNGGNNGAGYGTFLLVHPVSGDLAGELFPEDSGGNVYRASIGAHSAQLVYRTNPDQFVTDGYFKTSNQTENDWSDLVALTYAFSQAASEAEYFAAMSTNVNVEAWMRYFALGTLLSFGETSMFNGLGDDYALYRGGSDRRFVPIGHDFDTIFGQGDTITGYYPVLTNSSIYIMMAPPSTGGGFGGNVPNITALRRFMTNDQFAPVFFGEVKRLCDTVFAPEELNPLFDQLLSNWGNGPTATTISEMKTFAQNRRTIALSQIPLTLTVGGALGASNGLLYTTAPGATLFGQSHAIDTRRVLVNGVVAGRSPWEARWTNTVSLQPGVNRVLVQSLNSNNTEFARATVDVWYDDGSVTSISGAIASDTAWTSAQGPYQVTGNLTVNSGVTLTIQPGTTVFLNSGVNITVANGGKILAEGTDSSRIWIGNAPGVATWGGITINGGAGSPESRIAFTHITGNNSTAIEVADGTVFLDHLTFGNAGRQYISLDRASFVVQDCLFPATTAGFEPVHGTGGIKAGGHGLVRRNFWGKIQGYNDAFDFTGGNRPGPILQVLNNVFMGSDDDLLDLDSTDAWVEGNIFLHTHRNNGSPDSSSAVSGGSDNADNSQITVIGNIIYDCDQAANAKQTNFYTLINNTIVHQSRVGSLDTNAAVVILADDTTSQGLGTLLEGNIIDDAENLTRNVTTALVTFTNNIIHLLQGASWSGPGGGNVNADPLFKKVPQLSETTNFNSWAEAQVMWDWFSLKPGSPAIGAGPNGRDLGAVAYTNGLARGSLRGVSISGEPVGSTPLATATLRVDPNRTGNGIPVNGFPNGSGFTHYKWRLDGGAWSAETPTATAISLSGLGSGAHFVEVVGKNDAGFYQDDPIFGSDAVVTVSRTWTVDPAASTLRLNEVLASNSGAVNHFGTMPDAIELYNASDAPLDLAGVRLSDELDKPDKFIFPSGAGMGARSHLVVFANNPDGTPGHHLGFNLSREGGALYLFNAATAGGALIDSVHFGLQLTDVSVGRLADGSWTLTQPTFGSANRPAILGDPRALRINEWLAVAVTPFDSDFVELYNGDSRPVALGGLYFTDNTLGQPARHQMPALSFMAGNSYLRFIADGDAGAGADHLNFSLNGDQGGIAISLPDLTVIDCVVYQAQQPNISQGRSPNGTGGFYSFDTLTPGAPNPLVSAPPPFGGALVINELLANNTGVPEPGGRTPDWAELYNGTTNAIDLSDFSLSDSTLLPRRFVFSNATQITAGGHLRILCDDGRPATNDNTGFGLRGAGGAVYLFNSTAGGGSVLNSIVYGVQTPNLSIGRVPSGSGNWTLTTPTPGAANTAVPNPGSAANLKVNEWMADPASGDDWFEIYNPNPQPVAIGSLFLTDDLNDRTKHQIVPLSFIGTGTNAFLRFHADGNTGAGADHTSFSLRAAGESVGVSATNGALIDGVTFGAQQTGVSEGRFPDGGTNIVSFPGTASPGDSNWRRLANVVINEALTHTDLPFEDAIELRNLTAQPVDVGGWWLSDDNGERQKYQIPAPGIIPPNGFTVIYETVFTNRETAAIPFALSSRGDEVVLSASSNGALTGFRAAVDFGAAAGGISFGRYVTSDAREEFVAMSARTFGADDPGSVTEFRTGTGTNNAYPKVGPIVISEIMYHPADLGTNDNVRDEFIELRNTSTVAVPLFESTNGWHLRDAVDFDFPIGTVLNAGATLLVVSFDPVNNPGVLADFRARYALGTNQPIVGPYSGKLANDSDAIELRRPDGSATNGVPYILAERVRYFDSVPWPNSADGTGLSLHRISETGFGNDPTNWLASAPTPGPPSGAFDSDGDGLPDAWELQYGFDRLNPADAALDTDGDGLTNLQEYQLGTDPRNAASGLRLNIAATRPNPTLSFNAVSNFTYTVQYADMLGGPWQALQTYSPAPINRVVLIPIPATAPSRFYRLVLGTGLAGDALRFNSIAPIGGGQVLLNFTAPANQSYTVEFVASLGSAWSPLTNYPAAPTNRTIQVAFPVTGSTSFYRLRSP